MAGLQGYVNITPITNGITINSDGVSFSNNLDFLNSTIIEISTNSLDGRNDFAPFVGETGTIVSLPGTTIDTINNDPNDFINAFIDFDGSFHFDLYEITPITIGSTNFGSAAYFSASGQFVNESSANEETDGVLNFTVDFAGFTETEVSDMINSQDNNFVSSFSINGVAVDSDPDIVDIPEPSTALSFILFFGFFFAFSALYRLRKPQNKDKALYKRLSH